MGCIHHLIKFTPKLAELSEPLQPFLSKTNIKAENKLDCKDHHTKAFEAIKKQIISIMDNKHFGINKETKIKCVASRKRLGVCLEQKHNSIWKPVAYASCFLYKLEERYSANYGLLLSIVWSLEHFKYFFTDISSYYKQIIRHYYQHSKITEAIKHIRVDYQDGIQITPIWFCQRKHSSKNIGFAYYLSRNSSGKPTTESDEDEELFVVNTIQEIKHALLKHLIETTGI